MILSKRLETILSMIDPCQVLLDLGSDHAFLCIEAIKRGIAQQAIAADNKKGPIQTATFNIEQAQLSQQITPVLSDGATSVEKPADCWVIAGMGAQTIIQILTDSFEKSKQVKQILLSPHSKDNQLREFLYQNGYSIIEQRIVKDDRYYPIIKVQYSGVKQDYSLSDLLIGPMTKDHTYLDWIKHQRNHFKRLSMTNDRYINYYQVFNQEYEYNQSQGMD